ncbi:MAG: MBL fold metallo-hydrolase [Armatimonadetes bacterium]|nr:MBL fold metallo-hydrolase [Akkermansiaceae bacterium]
MVFKSLCRDVGIGANSYLLKSGGISVILDAGMHPKEEGLTAIPRYELVDENTVDAIFVTHSHLDHVGTLPVLMEQQKDARVFLSPETAELALAMLHNSVNVMESKRTELGITDYPFFHHGQLDRMKGSFELRNVGRNFEVDAGGKIRAEFFDAGHIMGSVGVMFEIEGKKVFYTGDVNFEDSTLQKGAIFPQGEVDVLIVETTRGEQARRADYSRRAEENAFAEAINGVLKRGGSALVPVFAMGKTQEVLAMLQRFKEDGLLNKKTPVYIGGLSTKMTTIYDKFSDVSRRNRRGFKFLTDMELAGGNRKRVGPIPFNNGCIYALSSGMMSEKTVSNNFARQGVLENKKHGLFFVGYADSQTPGGRIRAAKPGDKVILDPAYPAVPLNCEVRVFDFSGHSTRDAIADFAVSVKPKKIFLVHGDLGAMGWFKQELERRLPGAEVYIPEPGVEFEL